MKSNNIYLPPMKMCGPGLTGYLAPSGAQISVDYKKVPPMLRPIYHLVMGPLSVLFATGHFGIYNLCEGEQVGASGGGFGLIGDFAFNESFNNMFILGPTKSGLQKSLLKNQPLLKNQKSLLKNKKRLRIYKLYYI